MKPMAWTRGKLLITAVSLLYRLTCEILKWQDPVLAASAAFSKSAESVRTVFSRTAPTAGEH